MIPYVRSPSYLSASALRQLEERPVEFYLRRLGPSEGAPPPEPQSFPAAVGIAFDAYVKEAVAKECALRGTSTEFLLRDVKEQRDRALAMGAQLLYGYRKSGAMKRLLEEKPQSIQHDAEDYAPGTRVPVRARLDCIILYGSPLNMPTPLDWKVSGANRPGQVSPTPGYNNLWDSDTPGIPLGPHPRCGEPLEALDEDWATQLSIYGWAMGQQVGEHYGCIDEVVVGKDGRTRVAQFRSKISEGFQRSVVGRLEKAWAKIESREVVPQALAALGLDRLRVMQ